jgi:hypothetical protein
VCWWHPQINGVAPGTDRGDFKPGIGGRLPSRLTADWLAAIDEDKRDVLAVALRH